MPGPSPGIGVPPNPLPRTCVPPAPRRGTTVPPALFGSIRLPPSPLHEPDRIGARTGLGDVDGTGTSTGTGTGTGTESLQTLRFAPRHLVAYARPTRRRPLPRVPPLRGPFGEEHLRPPLEFVRRGGMPMPDPASGAGRSAVP
ncbi:hypothetical protein [Streptomyces doebereineriae]